MSWSFSATGKPVAVLGKASKELAAMRCQEPEEAIKTKVAEIIEASLAAFPADMPVKIEASGSQSSDTRYGGGVTNSLSLKIEPIWGFLEDKPAT